jgi:predicted TIM-barrel fold metal-dependent hydrolase
VSTLEDRLAWLDQVKEEVLEPERPITDPHHHLWPGELHYLLDDLWKDTDDGHNITKTVFIECSQEYLSDDDESLRPIGETIFVRNIALEAKKEPDKAQICGIVGHADLLSKNVPLILEKHLEEGQGLFKGIRHAGGWDHHDEIGNSHHNPQKNLYLLDEFSEGLNELEKKDLSFEAWQYHHQIDQVTLLAKEHPKLKIVLNHFSGPIGIGPYQGKQNEIFEIWKKNIDELVKNPNVYAKLGGLAMPINGYDFHKQSMPPSSDELVQAQKHYYEHSIKSFGPERCMFESNFPVDKQSVSYRTVWNAFKKMTKGFSQEDKDYLFMKSAEDFYSL